jgi:hypothetical protein
MGTGEDEEVTIKLSLAQAEKLFDVLLDARDQGVPVRIRRSARLQEITDIIETAIALHRIED